ncbi:MAG TPA: methylated-DNA--[protein]-cysteine S-methyltransferase [Candidatus Binatia bacterium]|nr:methylated-DNA--[protein]-cysteine S-methyltransferase [Candidatus Binatia bacterium]
MNDRTQTFTLPIRTADGEFLARYSAEGLCALDFPSGPKAPASTPDPNPAPVPPHVRLWHALTVKALGRALAGQAAGRLPPLDLSCGTKFQQTVWQALSQITCGRNSSYSQVAHAIGRPKAVRAVGAACGANPIPVLVPCHRVLASDQGLGGFSAGLDWKRTLLAREGVRLAA